MADPFPTGGETAAPPGVWAWISGPLFALFGGGMVWGATRTTIKHHGRRIGSLEENAREDYERLSRKMDANHRQLMNALLRRKEPDGDDEGEAG